MNLEAKQTTTAQPRPVPQLRRWLSIAARHLAVAVGAQQKKGRERRLNVEETLVLGPKRQLLLVRCDGERFLVGLGADTIQTVLRLDAPSGVIRTLHIADAGDRG